MSARRGSRIKSRPMLYVITLPTRQNDLKNLPGWFKTPNWSYISIRIWTGDALLYLMSTCQAEVVHAGGV